MVTMLAWWFYCEVIGYHLYEFMLRLRGAEYDAMNFGFDAEERRLVEVSDDDIWF